jgi:hypothetical protein
MKKIKLDVDTLAIESFPTVEDVDGERGTVHGRATLRLCSGDYTCVNDPTCLGDPTCASACSETDGWAICKSCGPCCYE